MFVSKLILAALSFGCSPANGFLVPTPPRTFGMKSRLNALPVAASKFFQLQEMEDKDTATTEVFLHDDGRVDFFDTDGPVPLTSEGTWELSDNDDFSMTVTRTFEGGKEESKTTDMGEFKYRVDRSFQGRISKVGAKLAVEGAMHDTDENLGERKVGFFEMIDTTDDRLGYEKKAQQGSVSS